MTEAEALTMAQSIPAAGLSLDQVMWASTAMICALILALMLAAGWHE